MRSLRIRQSAGFTLIELLIVMIVLAVLAGIVIPRFLSTKERAFVATLRSDLRNLTAAQSTYHGEAQAYAGNLDVLSEEFTSSEGVVIAIDSASTTGWGATATHPGTGETCTVAVSQTRISAPECEVP